MAISDALSSPGRLRRPSGRCRAGIGPGRRRPCPPPGSTDPVPLPVVVQPPSAIPPTSSAEKVLPYMAGRRLLDANLVVDLRHARDRLRDLAGALPILFALRGAAQLDHAADRLH